MGLLLDTLDLIGSVFGARELIPQPRWGELEAYAKSKAFGMAGVWKEVALEAYRDSIIKAIEEGLSPREWAQRAQAISDRFGLGLNMAGAGADSAYTDLVYRMGIANATADGKFAAQFDEVGQAFAGHWRYLAIRDDRNDEPSECPHVICRGLHGAVFSKDDAQATIFWPPVHFNCFPGDTRVVGDFKRGYRASYAGPVVDLVTVCGKRLTLTVNHPVLTPRGWVPANLLREGDDVFSNPAGIEGNGATRALLERASLVPRADREPALSIGVHFDDRPAESAQLFGSLGLRGLLPGVRVDAVDFDGDAVRFKGEVETVATLGTLLRDRKTALAQRLRRLVLVASDAAKVLPERLGGAFHLGSASLASRGGFPGGGALSLDRAPVGLQRRPLQEFSCRSAPKTYPGFIHGLPKASPRNSGSIGDALHALSATIGGNEFGRKQGSPASGSGSLAGIGGLVTRLRSVHLRDFCGEVYDFETSHGAILAEGILIGNCRCFVQEVPASMLKSRGYRVWTSGEAIATVGLPPEGFGEPRSPVF